VSVSSIEISRGTVGRPGYVQSVAALVFVWGFGDAVSTVFAFAATGSLAMEANPLVRLVLAQNPLLVVVLKTGVAVVVGAALLACRERIERVPLWRPWLLSVTALGAAVVASNGLVAVRALA